MSKGKGDKPSGFEDLMLEYSRHRPRKRRIPSRADWDTYPRYYLGHRSRIKDYPTWPIFVGAIIITGVGCGLLLNLYGDSPDTRARLIFALVLALISIAVCAIAARDVGTNRTEPEDDNVEQEEE